MDNIFRQPYDPDYNSSLYDTPVGYSFGQSPEEDLQNALEASMTQQSHAYETDVNVIVSRALQTGVLPNPNGSTPVFGDLTGLPTYLEAQIIVANANEAFAQLPSELRDRFSNDPTRLLAFMEDEKNFDEAVRLGLVNPPSAPVAPEAGPVPENAQAA